MKMWIFAIVLTLAAVGNCLDYESRVDALEQMLGEVQTKTVHQNKVIQKLKQQLETVQRSEDTLKNALTVDKRVTATPVVAFFATRQQNLTSITLHQTIVFEDATVNVQNAYNNNTGVFTCPLTGLYEFATTIVSAGEHHNLNFQMMMESTEIAYVHATLYEYDMGTQVAVAHCNKGQRVLIRQATHSRFGLPGGFCTFSGHLIQMY
ncbi:complement C1q-like protein 4 [Ylistrum balloti]|uniref:complement C1q-like protein 4 n=1 Tax=Ylistrum balloti TaxID=509963 RepID=UPI0029058D0C|nr:complement C1q-like protein 4 [Ylistrum balloti]